MSAAHRSVADPRLSGIRRIALRFSIIFQNVCTATNKPTDSVEPSTTYTAYKMPDITASGKRGKEEKDGQTTFFAISHNDIIKNFNECQANSPFLQNYLEWCLLLFASFQYFLIMRFLPAVMLPTYGVSLSRSFSYS